VGPPAGAEPGPGAEAEPAALWAAGLEPDAVAWLVVPPAALPVEALAPAAGAEEDPALLAAAVVVPPVEALA
jgi:hypothetical protein